MKKFKKRWILYGLLAVLFYMVVGAAAPFLPYEPLSQSSMDRFRAESLLDGRAGGDRAMILETGQSAWEERIRLMSTARERIILSTFDMRTGESTSDLWAVMLHKADEGVSIQILVDGFNGVLHMEGQELFYAVAAHPNVQIKIYNRLNLLEPWKTQGRMHDKYVIVDHTGYILGGRNTFDYFIGNYNTESNSLDREVLVYNTEFDQAKGNSSIFELEDYFNQVWNKKECVLYHDEGSVERPAFQAEIEALHLRYEMLKAENPELFEDSDFHKRTVPAESVRLLSGSDSIYGKEPEIFYQLTELMKLAEERVIIHTPYAVCNSYMYETLAQVKQQVPDSRIVLNSVENGDNFFASSDYLRNKDKLIDTGIQLYEYDGGHSTHGKSIVIDDNISIVGSYNLDLRSTYVDTELMVAIKSEELTAILAENMETIEKDCRKVISETEYETPEHVTVQEIPPWKRFAFWLVGLLMQPFRVAL